MTKEEAIKILRIRKEYVTLIKEDVLDEALDVAIEALSADRPSGEWVVSDNGKYQTCSNCGLEMFHSDWAYCPNCGARMSNK